MQHFSRTNIYAVLLLLLTLNECNKFVCGDKVVVVELANVWSLRNQNGSVTVDVPKIPSGVYTALSSKFGNVLDSKNDESLRWIAYDNWTYTKTFNVNQEDFTYVRSMNLTLLGIDTIANVRLNGIVIGRTASMFVRYSYNVLPYLKTENVLEIEILSPVWAADQMAKTLMDNGINTPPNCPPAQHHGECHRNMLRKQQSSFGTSFGPAAPSMGIWRSVALEYFEVAIMRNVDVAVQKNSTHWIMDVQAFLSSGLKRNFLGNFSFYAPELLKENPIVIGPVRISFQVLMVKFSVAVPKDSVELWWPNGYGQQTLYPIYITANCWVDAEAPSLRAKSVSRKSLKIGFRTIELIEDLDEHGRTFYFKVNGHPIFIKGANYVPSHILPERSADQDRIKHLLESARDVHMNMIRVWGGGLYESDYFYNLADTYGLLVWQDMAFTAAAYPFTDDFVDNVRKEISQNAKRIAYHTSLALIVTNNEIELYMVRNKTDLGHDAERLENEYKKLFVGTIKHELNIISRNTFDPRPGPMISTPSKGIEESKKDLPLDLQSVNYGDIHFFADEQNAWDPDIYPRARFISEYGFQSLPAMSSWELTLGADDDVAELIKHRQHDRKGLQPMLQLIERHFPLVLSEWEQNIEAVIYFSQVAQAMTVQTATQLFRSQRINYRTMGALYWQLNDVWIAPSWSSIDYYGNYKLLHYWCKDFLAPVSIIALYDAKNDMMNVTLTRDEITDARDARVYTVTINAYMWSNLFHRKTVTRDEILESNSVQQRFIPLNTIIVEPYTLNKSFLEFVLSDSEQNLLSSTYFFPSNLRDAQGISDPKLTFKLDQPYCNQDTLSTKRQIVYSITVHVKSPALFVFIEISHPQITKYKLSHNGFIQTEPMKVIHLEYEHKSECLTIVNKNIKVQTMNKYLMAARAAKNT